MLYQQCYNASAEFLVSVLHCTSNSADQCDAMIALVIVLMQAREQDLLSGVNLTITLDTLGTSVECKILLL